jgi:phospholipid/cholesterol/gamma-HCH transport system substrate-binding protein
MKQANNVKLGVFVTLAMIGTFILFYLVINKNNLWESSIQLKSRFNNIQGLRVGNNVRYGGMHIGIVKEIYLINDTTIEVVMSVNKSMQAYIHKNAIAFISSDGFVGDKLINIKGEASKAALVQDGDILKSSPPLDINELMAAIDAPETGINSLLNKLNSVVAKIDNSNAVWDITTDNKLANSFKTIIGDIQQTTESANLITSKLNSITTQINDGKGLVGALVKDSLYINKIDTLLNNSSRLIRDVYQIANNLNTTMSSIQKDLREGNGLAYTVLKDSAFSKKIEESVFSIQAGTKSFNEVMSALKKSIFLRKAFKDKAGK